MFKYTIEHAFAKLMEIASFVISFFRRFLVTDTNGMN
jgi:hypothetical protein